MSSPQSVATRNLSNIFSLCPILKFPSSLTLSLQCASAAKANRFMNFRHIGNGTECASPPSLINPIPPDSTVFCLRGAIASTTSDFVFKFRAIALTKTIIQLIPSSFSFNGTQKFHRFFNSKRVSFTSSSHQFGFVNYNALH